MRSLCSSTCAKLEGYFQLRIPTSAGLISSTFCGHLYVVYHPVCRRANDW